jgi:hypothetical protein
MTNGKWKTENGKSARIAERVSPPFSIFHFPFFISDPTGSHQ